MKLYRFVGENEVYRLLTNETLENNRDWSELRDTNSKGICFFANNKTTNIEKIVETALDEWGFAGIVKDFALVEIEVETARKAWGFYSGGKRTEYNLSSYSLENVTAIYRLHNAGKEQYLKNKYSFYKTTGFKSYRWTAKKVF